MNKQEITNRNIMLEEIHEQLEEHRKQFISVIRGNKAFYKPAIEFTSKIEQILAWYQMELMSVSVELIKQIESERYLIKIMEMHGINPSEALSGWSQWNLDEAYEHSKEFMEYRVPEKLKPYIDWGKVERDVMKNKMRELQKEFPHLSKVITQVFEPQEA